MCNEIWLPVKEYENIYEVSNIGRVKSLKYNKEKILKPNINNCGYYTISLSKNKIEKKHLVHRLVGLSFIKNTDKTKNQINHKNGIKSDNLFSNLEWVTNSENGKHAFDNGLNIKVYGEKVSGAKLTDKKVIAIRRLFKINPKINKRNLAAKIGVRYEIIVRVLNRTTWNHLQ